MKKNLGQKVKRVKGATFRRVRTLAVEAALLTAAIMAHAADKEQDNSVFEGGEKTYENWIELGFGGLITSGDSAQAEQRHRLNEGAFGGIEDLHFQKEVAKKTTFTLDGRAIYDNHDYSLALGLEKEETWFVRLNFENYRTWYNTDGGYYPPAAFEYSRSDDAAGLDRGEVSFEAGLTLKNKPAITFKYTHAYRDGDKSSTIWGQTHPLGTSLNRGLGPTFYDIDETRDTFELNVTHHIKKTDFGIGLRYETGQLDNSLDIYQFKGEPAQRNITDKQGVSYDLFSAHAFTETWFKPTLMFSTGFLYTDLCNDFSGSRVYGDDFDVNYSPNSANGLGFNDLNGSSHLQEYVVNLNLMTIPLKHLTIVPSVRVQKECWNADSSGIGTLGNSTTPFNSTSDGDSLEVRERLDIRYNGVTNWVFWGSTEFTEGQGSFDENGGLSQVSGIGVAPVDRRTDTGHFFQKYAAGVKWYPSRRVVADIGGYYKKHSYDYDNTIDDTPNDSANRYPAYLEMQDFETYDGNARLTLHLFKNVTLVSRYEYQISTIHTKPDPDSGLSSAESCKMTSHIFAQNISWIPWSRLALQAGFNYVLSETKTPESDYVPSTLSAAPILKAQNNYWTVNFNSDFVVNDKTDLNLGYFYYRANDYQDNADVGLPYGAGAEEHGVTVGIVRRINDHLRLNVKYGFYSYRDELSGGNNDYDAHLIFTGLQYRF